MLMPPGFLQHFESALPAALHAAWKLYPRDRARAAQEAAALIQPLYAGEIASVEARMLAGGAAKALHERSAVMDALLSALFAFARDQFPSPAKTGALALVAVGGYGRGELFPYSDIDLLFLHEKPKDKHAALVAEFTLYVLWGLGLKVGHAVRDEKEAFARAMEDMTIRTSLLEAHTIAGEAEVTARLLGRMREEILPGSAMEFVEAKLAERERRHTRMGGTRYALEPNVKEGKGALRDLHSLAWIVHYSYPVASISEWVKAGVLSTGEMNAYLRAQQFLWEVRTHLHRIAGRAEERLTFDFQKPVAVAMGYHAEKGARSPEGFMKRYFQTAKIVGSLTRIVCAVLEEEKKRKPSLSLGALLHRQQNIAGFALEGTWLVASDEAHFTLNSLEWLRLFALAQAEKLDIHPRMLRIIAHGLRRIDRDFQKNPDANALFLQMLTSPHAPEATLRRLAEAGILGRFIPDFGRIIGQMQYDRYHTLTVDEHTLCAIGILNDIETGKFHGESPVASGIIHQLESKRVLFLALFCHDLAKGQGGDHSALGEKIARKLASRFGFTLKEQEDTAWLVANHLLFSHTAFKRDITDTNTVRDFVEKIQSPERLRLLLVLTVADIRAVGPGIWNGWKGALLRELYTRAEAKMGAGRIEHSGNHDAQLEAEISEMLAGEDPVRVRHYLSLGTPSFWMGCDAEEHRRIFALLEKMEHAAEPFMLDSASDAFRAITQIIIVTPDQHALFSKIAGAMALAGASIVTARAYTLKNGMAIDMFGVQDAQKAPFDQPEKIARLRNFLDRALTGRIAIAQELLGLRRGYASRMDALKVPAAVYIENTASASFTVIEVNGRDRVGFLHDVTQKLAALGLNIATAIVTTYGDRAVDVFYVKDVFGHKITHAQKLRQIRETLMQAIAPPAEKKVA